MFIALLVDAFKSFNIIKSINCRKYLIVYYLGINVNKKKLSTIFKF